VTGALWIPSLQIKAPVLSGCSFVNLERGACWLHGSATLGGFGNAAVAGHRDKDFRRLEHIRKGMEIFVSSEGEQYQYVVDFFEIVSPEDVQVLATHEHPELTLITCYPFHYVGPAPNRFIVHARLIIDSAQTKASE
jgi:sortase A